MFSMQPAQYLKPLLLLGTAAPTQAKSMCTGCQPQAEGSWDVLVCVCAFLAVRFRGIDVLGTCKARVSFLKEVHF